MKKIQIYVENIKYSESDKQVILLCNSLSNSFDITIVSLGNIKNEIVLNKKVKLVELNMKNNNGYLNSLKIKNSIIKFIKVNACDIIISTSLSINKILSQINITSAMIYWRLDDEQIKRESYKKYLGGFSRIVFSSEEEKNKFHFDDIESTVISPAIASVSLDYDYVNSKTMLCIESFADENRFNELMDIIKLVKKEDDDIKLNIIGDESNRLKAIKDLRDQNLRNNITFLGELDSSEIDYELKRTSLYINFDDSIESNINLIEAMNYGVPCISYYNETLKNIIENDINGYLIEQNDLLDFANKIVLVLSSPETLNNMRSCARETSMFYEINSIKVEWLKIL